MMIEDFVLFLRHHTGIPSCFVKPVYDYRNISSKERNSATTILAKAKQQSRMDVQSQNKKYSRLNGLPGYRPLHNFPAVKTPPGRNKYCSILSYELQSSTMMKYACFFLMLYISAASFAQTDTIPSGVYYVNELPVLKDSSRYRIQIMDGCTPYLSNMEVHITMLEPGKSAHAPHKHANTEELIIVKEGKLKVTIAGETKTLGPGGVAMAMPGDLHEAVNESREKVSYYLLKYTKKGTDSIVPNTKAIPSILVDWDEVAVQKNERGFRRQQFNQATVLFEKFDMHATTLKQNEISHPPHTHRQEEIIIVRKGNIEMQIGDTFQKAQPGDIIFLNSNIPHALKNLGKGACEYFAFQWQ